MSHDTLLPPLYPCLQLHQPPLILIRGHIHTTIVTNIISHVFHPWQILYCSPYVFNLHPSLQDKSGYGVFFPAVLLSHCAKAVLLVIQILNKSFQQDQAGGHTVQIQINKIECWLHEEIYINLKKVPVFWNVLLCDWVRDSWHFEGTWSFDMSGATRPITQCLIPEGWSSWAKSLWEPQLSFG